MGKGFFGGGSTKQKSLNLLTPQQQQFMSSVLGSAQPFAGNALSQALQPINMDMLNSVFEKSYLQPAMSTFNDQIVPAIQQRFADANAGSSSALNRALATAGGQLSTNLGNSFGNLYQNAQNNQMGALGLATGLAGGRQIEPYLKQNSGTDWSQLIGPLVSMLPLIL